MPTRRGNARRQTTEKREWVHVDGVGAVTVGLAQLDANQAVGQKVQALLAERRSEDVFAEGLTGSGVLSACASGSVQGESHLGDR
jgi:hypothetical protein